MMNKEKGDLQQKKDRTLARFTQFGLQVAFIFGVPAGLGAYLGVSLDAHFGTGRYITLAVLFVMFTLSWVVVGFKYKKLNKELEDEEAQIKSQ